MIIAFLDEKGNVREPKDWQEVKESVCDRWDSCSPCSYAGGPSRTGGGFVCRHAMATDDWCNGQEVRPGKKK